MSDATAFVGQFAYPALTFAAGALGAAVTRPAIPTWYASLRKPPGTPPNWVFGVVWTVLYTLMAAASYLVWRTTAATGDGEPLRLYTAQLALNALWSVLFFGLQMPGLALVEIHVLWLAVLATTLAFFQVDPIAGLLMVPYLLWVTYATYLNYGIWRLNRP